MFYAGSVGVQVKFSEVPYGTWFFDPYTEAYWMRVNLTDAQWMEYDPDEKLDIEDYFNMDDIVVIEK